MAMEIYEGILKEKDLPQCIKADVLRQIGWMYHTLDSLGDKQTRLSTAVQVSFLFVSRAYKHLNSYQK